jgi:hypothetical protein
MIRQRAPDAAPTGSGLGHRHGSEPLSEIPAWGGEGTVFSGVSFRKYHDAVHASRCLEGAMSIIDDVEALLAQMTRDWAARVLFNCIALGQKEVSHDSGILNRTVVKWIALYVPLRWPPGIVTRPEIDQQLAGCTKPGDFGADVEQVEELVAIFTARGSGVIWPDHPIFATMSEGDWMRWGYLHMDHHLRQFGA